MPSGPIADPPPSLHETSSLRVRGRESFAKGKKELGLKAYRSLGRTYEQQGHDRKAAAIYISLLEHSPDDVDALIRLSAAYTRMGREVEAARYLDRLTDIYERHGKHKQRAAWCEAYRQLGEIHLDRGRIGRAIEKLQMALRCRRTDEPTLGLLAQALTKDGRHEDAARVTAALNQLEARRNRRDEPTPPPLDAVKTSHRDPTSPDVRPAAFQPERDRRLGSSADPGSSVDPGASIEPGPGERMIIERSLVPSASEPPLAGGSAVSVEPTRRRPSTSGDAMNAEPMVVLPGAAAGPTEPVPGRGREAAALREPPPQWPTNEPPRDTHGYASGLISTEADAIPEPAWVDAEPALVAEPAWTAEFASGLAPTIGTPIPDPSEELIHLTPGERLSRGLVLRRFGHLEEALVEIRAASASASHAAAASTVLGYCLIEAGRLTEGVEAFVDAFDNHAEPDRRLILEQVARAASDRARASD